MNDLKKKKKKKNDVIILGFITKPQSIFYVKHILCKLRKEINAALTI